MAYNFFELNRGQQFLLPENMRDWVPEGDLALYIIDVVERLDLSEFYTRYRADGWGAVAYDPRMMVALTVYAYCVGERSSRRIEKLCRRDAGFRLVSGNHVPDHSTIARFRKENEEAVLSLFGQALTLCARAGIVNPVVLAVDGTKIKASASMDANRTYASLKKEYEEIGRRILEEAEKVDAKEDRIYGPGDRGEEVPKKLHDVKVRQAQIRECLEEMEAEAEQAAENQQKKIDDREERRRAGEQHLGRNPLSPDTVLERFIKKAKVNTTDPESRIMKSSKGYVQGFNAQLAVTEDQIIVAAELTDSPDDWHLLHPMVELAAENIWEAGVEEPVGSVVADAGYGCKDELEKAETLRKESIEQGDTPYPDVFVATKKAHVLAAEMAEAAVTEEARENMREDGGPPASKAGEEKGAGASTAVEKMEEKLKTKEGREIYAKRGKTVEPVFGQMKDAKRFERFMRRGLAACKSEWSLMCTGHNLLKLWRSGVAIAEIG